MSEAIWIELIKVLPAFLWVAFGFIALAIAKRIFTAQAPRMSKIETPWVTVELAQQAIEQAAVRGPEPQIPPLAEPDWASLYPVPAQPVRAGNGAAPPPADSRASLDQRETDNVWGYIKPDEDPYDGPEPDPQTKPQLPNTPPADEPAEDARTDETVENGDRPLATVTAPNQQIPNIPPTYPVIAPPPGGSTYYGQASQADFHWNQLPAAFQQPPAYRPVQADNRSLRAATKLALAAGDLQGGAILWADDHQEWNDSLIRLFRTAGITVDPVASTDEAMRALGKRSYDLVITDLRREREADGDTAGIRLLDRMVEAGVPTPAVIYSDNPNAQTTPHPRAITTTNVPEQLVDVVVEFVADRREQSSSGASSWFDRLTGR
jgi:hypothetical protein